MILGSHNWARVWSIWSELSMKLWNNLLYISEFFTNPMDEYGLVLGLVLERMKKMCRLDMYSFSCNYMTIDWQSYDNNVTIIWQSCDNHIMILARVLLFHNRPKNCIWKGFLYMAKKINSMPIVSTWSIYHRNGQK